MKPIALDLSPDADVEFISIPRVAELQMELKALQRGVTWREIRVAGLQSVGVPPALACMAVQAWDPLAVRWSAFVIWWALAWVAMTFVVIWLARQQRRRKLMEELIFELIALQNQQRRALDRLAASNDS